MQGEETRITHGIKTLDSKLGTRANLFQPSVFMVSLNKPATEDEGAVLFGDLEYSGNFRTDIELDYLNNLKIISGINNYASPYSLKPNEEFITPAFLYSFSSTGKGNASRNMHNWARNYKILGGISERLTLLNNWEATYFDFNETKLFELLKETKELGVDLFLLDDGWFANKYPRNGRIYIQWQNSYFYPAITSSNHVTDWGKQSLKFRTDVAMMGKIGFDIVISHLKDQDLKFVQDAVKSYNVIKDVIWHGDQYRLANPTENSVASMLYINPEQTSAVMFNYLVNNRYGERSTLPILLKGLKSSKKYKVTEINLAPGTSSSIDASKVYSGEFLMTVGFNPNVNSGRNSVVLKLESIN